MHGKFPPDGYGRPSKVIPTLENEYLRSSTRCKRWRDCKSSRCFLPLRSKDSISGLRYTNAMGRQSTATLPRPERARCQMAIGRGAHGRHFAKRACPLSVSHTVAVLGDMPEPGTYSTLMNSNCSSVSQVRFNPRRPSKAIPTLETEYLCSANSWTERGAPDDAGGVSKVAFASGGHCQVSIPSASTHASPCLWLQAGQRWA